MLTYMFIHILFMQATVEDKQLCLLAYPGAVCQRVPSWSSGDSASAGAGMEVGVQWSALGDPSWGAGAAADLVYRYLVGDLHNTMHM